MRCAVCGVQGFFFYIDFYSDHHPSLPKFHLKSFCQAMFANCSFLQPHKKQFEALFAQVRASLHACASLTQIDPSSPVRCVLRLAANSSRITSRKCQCAVRFY